MASSSQTQTLILLGLLVFFLAFANAKHSFRPSALVLPVTKDASTARFFTHLKQRTPLVPVKLVLDLGGLFMWVDCDRNYLSSSYAPVHCGSSQCSLAKANGCGSCYAGPLPGCNNNTCGMFPGNTISGHTTVGELALDILSLQSTNGKNPGPVVSIPRFLFTCGSPFLLEGLANDVKGMAGLGRARIGMPSLFSDAFSFPRKFAICLPSSSRGKGVIFFGNGPFVMLPNIDITNSLIYTPLLTNPVSTAPAYSEGDSSYEYFIGVKSIKVNQKTVSLNNSLLLIDKKTGFGGTKISTINPYTVVETSIYKALSKAFIKEAKLKRVGSVAPFGLCFDSRNVGATRVGYAVPSIDLVLQSKSVIWRIIGANSMVQVKDKVICLGFVDGGLNPRTSIVIGAYQLEDNLLQFDLATSRLGFSSSLLYRQTTCSNFNFTSRL